MSSERPFFDGRLCTWSPFARKVMSIFYQNPRKHPKAPPRHPKAPMCWIWIWDAHGAPMGGHGRPWAAHSGPMQLHGEPIGNPWGPLGAQGVPLGAHGAHGEAIWGPMGRQWGTMGAHGAHSGSNHAKTIFTNSRSTALGRTLLVYVDFRFIARMVYNVRCIYVGYVGYI